MTKYYTLISISLLFLLSNCNSLFSQEKKIIIQRNNVSDNSQMTSIVDRNVLTVLNNNGAVDTNGRAPQGSRLFVNTCYIIRPSEMVSSGFGTDTVKSIGWTWNAAKSQNITTKGTLKVYIVNTTDTAYNKGTNFTTAISGMTKIIDDSISVLAGLGPFTITVPVGGPGTSNFITTSGQGVYIAFEYKTTSTLATPSGSPTISCNNSLTNRGGTYQSQSANGTTLTLSAFAPETKLGNSKLDSVDVRVLYCLGGIPSTFACNDTLGIRVKKNYTGTYTVVLRIKIKKIDSPFTTDSTDITLPSTGIYDTLINFKIPCILISYGGIVFKRDRIIVEALSGNLDDKNNNLTISRIYDSMENCQYTTYDFYNYADPCASDNGGIGINNSSGNIVARFNNYSDCVLPIVAVEHSFYNNSGGGNQTYEIVIYGDNGSGMPGSILYTSPTLTSPAGTGFAQKVSHTLTSFVNINANSRFYVGMRQNGTTNMGFSFQNEIPVRSKAFFYSYPYTSNSWTDFSSSGANYKLDISPILGVVAPLNSLQEGFTSVTFPPAGWAVVFTGTNYWSRNSVSSFGVGSGSAKFDFFNAPASTAQSIVTSTFSSTAAGNVLQFDFAYAPFTTGTDSLKIETSTNGGANYSTLTGLYGNSAGGTMNTAPASTISFTPTSSQWLTNTYTLPAGTNKIRFKAISGFGNNLYLDSISVFTPLFKSKIKLFIEGFYNSGSNTMIPDTINVFLRSINSPYNIIDSSKSLLSSSGTGNFIFKNAATGKYYLQIKHRNSIETWSRSGGDSLKRGSLFTYDFTDGLTKAYGSNMTQVDASPVSFAIYSGDVNQDGTIDEQDLSYVENDAGNSISGYVYTDVTGDDFVDAGDLSIIENNAGFGVSVVSP